MQFFQAVLYRLVSPSNHGPWRAVVLDTQDGPPAFRAREALNRAWYALVWQHNLMTPADLQELLVTRDNWHEHSIAVTPMEWYRTPEWIKRRQVCPDAFTFTPAFLDEIELDRWKVSSDRR